MEIKNLRIERQDNMVTALASLVWEDSGQKNQDLYFRTTEEFGDALDCAPEAFLTGCLLPAIYFGEKRIKIEGEICPTLKKGLLKNLKTFRQWYGVMALTGVPKKYPRIVIEAKERTKPAEKKNKRTGLFLSGGIDSLYSLRVNRLNVPRNEPHSIQDCFLVHGFDIGYQEGNEAFDVFDRAVRSLKEIIDDTQVNLIPVYTNLRRLHNELHFWEKCFHGAALAAVAHCFTKRIDRIIVASSHDKANLEPYGSHYLIDPNYSSRDIQIVYDKLMKRFHKTRVLVDWDAALHNFRVCTKNKADLLNCGKCQKCLRNMTHLAALGKLQESRAFRTKEISLEAFAGVIKRDNLSDFHIHYVEIVGALREQGRNDLADIIMMEENSWQGKVRRWDGSYLNGYLVQGWKLIRGLTSQSASKV